VHFKETDQWTLEIHQYNSARVGGPVLIIRFLHSPSQQTAFSLTVTKLDSEAGINILPSGLWQNQGLLPSIILSL